MSPNEELEEQVHHAHDPFDKRVAATMAIMAALLAIVSVLGQHFNTEKILNQQLSSDQWAYYNAKDIRRYTADVAQATLAQMKADPKLIEKYLQDESRYKKQATDIQEKARDFLKERDKAGRRADYFHFGEVFLEVAIVFSSLSILTRAKVLFFAGGASAVIGLVISIAAWTA
ncbi:MAG: DUF4337 domain-containing protein [Bryobacteraceae bacterium]